MIHFLAIGALLGLSAGLSPGPLLTLVIAETMQHGIRAGAKVAVAPVITDVPIILLTFWVLKQFTHLHLFLGAVALMGGGVVFKMGFDCLRQPALDFKKADLQSNSLTRGIVTNTLNPQPYLFWLTVGAAIFADAAAEGNTAVASFLGSFYLLLVGSKMTLAFIIGRSRHFLSGGLYLFTLRCLGCCLIFFALTLFYNGLLRLLNGDA